jgi:hypothetical protein
MANSAISAASAGRDHADQSCRPGPEHHSPFGKEMIFISERAGFLAQLTFISGP